MDLYTQGFIAAQDVDDAKASVSVQESAVEVANGQLASAQASYDSAVAQKHSAEQQASIVKTKGQADIEAARARMDQAVASLDYARANTSQTSAYKQSIAALQAGVDAARASLASAIAKRRDTVLVAPMDGFVTKRNADPGAIAGAGSAVLEVQFVKTVWVTIAVPDDVSTKLHIGQPAQVRLDAFAGRVFTGSVIQINPAADPESRQFTVRVLLNNAQGLLKPGMFGKVTLVTGHAKNAVAVPAKAVQTDETGSSVFTVDKKSTAHRVPVALGLADDAYVAILGAVIPGDKVVIMNNMPLRDGQKIMTGRRGGKGMGKDGPGGGGRR